LIYYAVSRQAPTLVALAAASSVPALDAVVRLLQRKAPSPIGLLFLVFTGTSVALATMLHSPMFILVKSAVISGLVGIAFALSALVGRPLTRTLALRLSSDHAEVRRRLAERWGHPRARTVFRKLSLWWGLLLIVLGVQQGMLAVTLPPGLVMAVDGPVHAFVTMLGIGASVLYVRRIQRAHPEVQLLPARAG